MSLAEKIRAKTLKKGVSVTRARARAMAIVTQAQKLSELLGPNLDKAVQVWVEGLKATKWEYDPKTHERFEVADWKERRECATKIIEYLEGKPIERQLQVTGDFEELGDLLNRIRESPLALKKLGHLVPDRAMPNDSDSLQIGPTVTNQERPALGSSSETEPTPHAEK